MSANTIGITIHGTTATIQVGTGVREQVRQSLQEAAQEMRVHGQELRDQASQLRDAQQQLQDAQQQLRNAHTADQRGAAAQSLSAAQLELAQLQGRSVRFETRSGFIPSHDMVPPQVVDIAIGFFIMCAVMVIGWPIARALGRRLERRGEQASSTATAEQLQRIEQAVEAMAIEVERISESQRFMAKLQQAAGEERAALPLGDRR